MPPDLTPLLDACVSAAALIISAASAVAAGYIRSHVKNAEIADLAAKAETMAAGVAYDSLTAAVAKGGMPDWKAAKAQAIAEGQKAAEVQLGAVVTATAVKAAMAPLLAIDPTVPAGGGTVATAVAPTLEAAAVAAVAKGV